MLYRRATQRARGREIASGGIVTGSGGGVADGQLDALAEHSQRHGDLADMGAVVEIDEAAHGALGEAEPGSR